MLLDKSLKISHIFCRKYIDYYILCKVAQPKILIAMIRNVNVILFVNEVSNIIFNILGGLR